MKLQDRTCNQLLQESEELAERLDPVIRQELKSRKPRSKLVRELRELVLKNAKGFKVLMGDGNFNCATVQLRIQYEAVARMVWVRFSAPETAVTKMLVGLTGEDVARSAGNLPMAKEMLDRLVESRGVPRVILRSLLRFSAEDLKESNSAVHSGPLAIFRHLSGYPERLLVQLIQASNDLLIATASLQVAVSGSRAQWEELALIRMEFASCLPPFRTAA